MREVQAKLKVVSIRSRFENPTRSKVVIEHTYQPFHTNGIHILPSEMETFKLLKQNDFATDV